MIQSAPAITIRRIRPEDAEALRALRLEALRDYPLAFTADLAENEARSPASWREQAARCAGRAPEVATAAEAAPTPPAADAPEVIMLADGGGRLAGMTGVSVPKSAKLGHAGTIWGVYVRPEFQGRGTARRLLEACVDWARARSLVTLRLSVVVGNDAAKRCYERCGFAVYGIEPLAVRWEGRLYDETLMSLRL